MSKANKLMVRRVLEAIWSRKDVNEIVKYFASDYLGHSAVEIHGPQGVIQQATSIIQKLGPLEFIIEDQIAEDDKVVIRWIARCHNEQHHSDGKYNRYTHTINGIDIFRVANGRIIEGWRSVNDLRSVLRAAVLED